MKPIRPHLRLLPLVILLMGGLVVLKGADLIATARAASAPVSPAPPATRDPARDPAIDPDDSTATESASEVDALTSLSRRRKELDTQSRELDMRSALLQAAEKRIDGKIADLKALQAQIQGLLGERDEAQKKQIASLVKVYSAMKPADAGRLFNTLDEDVLADVASGMKPDVLALIMAKMNSERAQSLTLKLAGRLTLPKAAELASAPAPQMPAAPGSLARSTAPAGMMAPGQTASAAPAAAMAPAAAPAPSSGKAPPPGK